MGLNPRNYGQIVIIMYRGIVAYCQEGGIETKEIKEKIYGIVASTHDEKL